MRDSTVIGVISGVIGGIAYQLFVWAFYLLGLADITPLQLGAYIFIKPGLDITNIPAMILGIVKHYGNSSLLGIITVYLLRFMGTDYLLLKGATYGAVIYVLLYGAIARVLIPANVLQPTVTTSIVFMIGNLIFGIITTYIAGILLKKSKAK